MGNHFIFSSIRKHSLEAMQKIQASDGVSKELSERLYKTMCDEAGGIKAMEAEDIFSELSARWTELAYLQGVQDMFGLMQDLSSASVLKLYKEVMGEADGQEVHKYGTKLVLHIPHFKWQDGRLVAIDYAGFKGLLEEGLAKSGAESWYCSMVRANYRGREYDEELITVFVDSVSADSVVRVFKEAVSQKAHELQQEAYAYEINHELFVY